MPTFEKTQHLVVDALLDEIGRRKRDWSEPVEFEFTHIARLADVYPATMGRERVLKGIKRDMKANDYDVRRVEKSNQKRYFVVTKRKP